jgi:HEPN domain-containing protein
MPPEQAKPGSPQEWLRYAASDLELAKLAGIPNVMIESLCYHAQQCAEKALKAVLVAFHVPVHRTHNIGLLLDQISEHVAIPEDLEEAAILTDYAVMCRYPGDTESVTTAEYEFALHLAEAVLVWAKRIIA